MPLVATDAVPRSRERLIRALTQQGAAGVVVMAAATALRHDEPARVLAAHAAHAPHGLTLLAILALFAVILSMHKFPLTSEIFVAPVVTAYVALIPLLGLVLSMWVAVAVAIGARTLAILGVGPTTIPMNDVPVSRTSSSSRRANSSLRACTAFSRTS